MMSRPGFISNMTIKVGTTIGDPGRSIRRWRTNLGWTQRELARRVNKPQGYISRVELNRLELSNEDYGKIATAMGLSMERMLSAYC